MLTSKRILPALALALLVAMPASVHAFCGFYVAGADTELYNNATMVTLMRQGTTTVLSMSNNYYAFAGRANVYSLGDAGVLPSLRARFMEEPCHIQIVAKAAKGRNVSIVDKERARYSWIIRPN